MNDNELINIFIIEDNRLFMLTLKAHIEIAFVNQKMKIYCFETGEACMDKFKEVKPQIAILDYHLNSITPDAANGIKILDWIKKEHKETFVIMLTANDNIEIASKSFTHGASDYVVKSETQFKKINYSLFNLIKILEVNAEAKGYKRLLVASFIGIAIIFSAVVLIQVFAPSLLD